MIVAGRLHRGLAWLRGRWLGRVVITGVESFVKLDMFDRSMTIAAQFFTSVFPILILLATWAASKDSHEIADAIGLPEETRSVLQDAIEGAGSATFGVVGVLIVLASATSLSRALSRAYIAIWDVPKPRSGLGSAWRWLAAVLVLTLALVAIRAASEPVDINPLREALPLLATVTLDVAVALFVPWVLLAGAVRPRMLAPGALLFALLMLSIRPATAAWLPDALEVSADRYGPIGVAFTYLACLYTASFCFLTTAVLGQVVATDRGGLGHWLRHTDVDEEQGESRTLRDVPAQRGTEAEVGVEPVAAPPSPGEAMSESTTSDTPVLDLLGSMTAESLAASSLDAQAIALVRLAALVASGAPSASYALNLAAAGEVGLDAEDVRGVLAAIAPIVGTPRVVAATGRIVLAIGVAIEVIAEDLGDEG